ncbi:Zn-ribbon domain-containing OB-fold protein [Frankia sp. ACN1ag]|uniref:Zn-ribbon domain-containing OB-fold protein n=1 Tax=Frankia sp. ACN1ag TaxID=102891 RepID=UPI0006DD2006|nr:zinc ribbon domain-containing protein [Frankia sp. ACN1ag]KQC36471.1 DNA-binding protein [Frankia sp. ACN1ag]
MARINHDTVELWQGWQRRELRVDRCKDCGTWVFPPRPFCPGCWSDALVGTALGGAGRLVSYSLPRVAPGSPPVVSGVVALAEAPGVRLLARIVGIEPERVTRGMPLALGWWEDAGGVYPQFGPVDAAPARPDGGAVGGVADEGAADGGAGEAGA